MHLAGMGQYAESLVEMKRACDLDPLSMVIRVNLALALRLLGDFKGARRELDPNVFIACRHLRERRMLGARAPVLCRCGEGE